MLILKELLDQLSKALEHLKEQMKEPFLMLMII